MIFNKKVKLDIHINYQDKGIIIDVDLDGNNILLPIDASYIKRKKIDFKDITLLNLLQNLWLDDLLTSSDDMTYIIEYANLYDIYDEYDNIDTSLDLSKNLIDINVGHKSFLGNSQFKIFYELGNSDYNNFGNHYTRSENVIHFKGDRYLLTKEQYALIREIDKQESIESLNDQAKYLAKVKKKAIKAGANIDSYLENEDCLFPEKIDIDLFSHDDKHIELTPKFSDIDNETSDILKSRDTLKHAQSIKDDNSYKRIFLDDQLVQKFNDISAKRHIRDADVPKFINNPFPYLPDEIDIEEFGERVKGLKIRTYKAQPFVNCNKDSETGWFQFDTGVNIVDDNPTLGSDNESVDEANSNQTIDQDEFNELIEKARENNEEYVYYNDKWIKVDVESGEDFIEKVNDFNKQYEDGKVSPAKIPYVLDIYENISDLEYNVPFIELKRQYKENELLEFKKPHLLNADLYPYQKEGYQWLKFLKTSQLGGLLADDMGLGKTIQLIAFIAYLKELGELTPTLIVLPSALIDNWISEIDKFVPAITSMYTHRGSNRCKDQGFIEKHDIVLTTYETLVRDQLFLGKIKWSLVVCDEAQKIKNATTLATTSVKALKTQYRMALTGTPVENSLSDLWCIVDYIQPGLLNSYDWFKKNYEVPIQKGLDEESGYEDKANELIKLIEPVFLRRTKEDKLDNLPQKHELAPDFVDLSITQMNHYMRIIQDGKQSKQNRALADIQNLLQICSHPRLYTKDTDKVDTKTLKKEAPKLEKTIQILKSIKKKNEKVIIFTKYRLMQDIFTKVLFDEFGIMADCINGSVTKNRVSIIDRFQSKEGFNVLLLSPRAAGVGLNIVGANHVIHYTRDWNPAVENQATDRTYRIGQKKDVYVYYPTCTSDKGITVEEKLDQLLTEKKKLVKQVIVPADKFRISEKDFRMLF